MIPSAKQSIFVTYPHLPPLEEYLPYLEEIWASRILTNNGPFHRELESRLASFLGVPYISLFCNATIALVTAIKALELKGEVITTPYSFVATSHALLWNDVRPVFVDIDPTTLNLDPTKIEAAITPCTTAIMPVHVYGHPCDVDVIEAIAKQHNLKVIYDAAHAFGVQCHCGSVLNHGDLSVLSFHATKVFNTFEGGAVICSNATMKKRIDQLKNFGFVDEVTVETTGINGKMSELNAALGLIQLKHIDHVIASRKKIDQAYREALQGVRGITCLHESSQATKNYSYFPIMVGKDYRLTRDTLYERLKAGGINTRRYFYPLISEFPMYRRIPSAHRDNLPGASLAAEEVLCLPIYPLLSSEDQQRVIDVIREARP